jgi:hypothetical protein
MTGAAMALEGVGVLDFTGPVSCCGSTAGWWSGPADGTMPLYLPEGSVIPMGPVGQWMGERPCDP